MRGLKRLLKLSARMTACKTSSSSISLSADCLEVILFIGKRVNKIDRKLQTHILQKNDREGNNLLEVLSSDNY